jgi:hypothetical protein
MGTEVSINLVGKIGPIGRVTLLRAELASASEAQFAVLFYSIDGVEQPLGLRLDLNKRALLDPIEDLLVDSDVAQMVNSIIEAIQSNMASAADDQTGMGYSEAARRVSAFLDLPMKFGSLKFRILSDLAVAQNLPPEFRSVYQIGKRLRQKNFGESLPQTAVANAVKQLHVKKMIECTLSNSNGKTMKCCTLTARGREYLVEWCQKLPGNLTILQHALQEAQSSLERLPK